MSKTLVFGASLNPSRYAYIAMHRLMNHGYDVVAFGLKSGTVAGVTIDTELKPYDAVDTITLYINPTRQEAYYNYLMNLKPRRVIFNPGTENPYFYNLLEAHGIKAEVACTLVLLGIGQY